MTASMKAVRSALAATAWLLTLALVAADSTLSISCSLSEQQANALDPNLQEMTVNLDGEEFSFLAYVQPNVTSFYKGDPPASTAVTPKFNGFAAKFINLSNRPLNLYWDPHDGGDASLMRSMPAFHGSGTASFPGHRFFFSDPETPRKKLIVFVVKEYPHSLYAYDPYEVPGDDEASHANLAQLTPEEREKYNLMKRSIRFSDEYMKVTGRAYLVNFPRPRPSHFMWPAEYFGQVHWVATKETHFHSMPPPYLLKKVKGIKRVLGDSDPRLLAKYRSSDTALLNMSLTVLSVAPRVLEIPNFLSQVEVDHILQLADGENMLLSSTGQDAPGDRSNMTDTEKRARRTRTSVNSWVERERTPVVDAVYRRAADLLRVDEALLRHRGADEHPDLGTRKSIAESLQLVHYDYAQEYTAHHDFGYAKVDAPFQSARFATLLLYLNDGMVGGSTTFPRWVNAESFEELKIQPEVGKAALFYSQLPDGNMDDFSQHAAKPVWEGEKFLINLWMHDPVFGV